MVGSVVYLAAFTRLAGRRLFLRTDYATSVVAIVAMAAIVMIAARSRVFYRNRSIDCFTVNATTCVTACSIWPYAFCDHCARPLLDSLVSRLQEVMNVGRVAIFIEDKHAPRVIVWRVLPVFPLRWLCLPTSGK